MLPILTNTLNLSCSTLQILFKAVKAQYECHVSKIKHPIYSMHLYMTFTDDLNLPAQFGRPPIAGQHPSFEPCLQATQQRNSVQLTRYW